MHRQTLLITRLVFIALCAFGAFWACSAPQTETSTPVTPLLDGGCTEEEWDDGVASNNNGGGPGGGMPPVTLLQNEVGPFTWNYRCKENGSYIDISAGDGPHSQYSGTLHFPYEGVWYVDGTLGSPVKQHEFSVVYDDTGMCYSRVELTWYFTDAETENVTVKYGTVVTYADDGPGEFRVDVEVRPYGESNVVANYILLHNILEYEIPQGGGSE